MEDIKLIEAESLRQQAEILNQKASELEKIAAQAQELASRKQYHIDEAKRNISKIEDANEHLRKAFFDLPLKIKCWFKLETIDRIYKVRVLGNDVEDIIYQEDIPYKSMRVKSTLSRFFIECFNNGFRQSNYVFIIDNIYPSRSYKHLKSACAKISQSIAHEAREDQERSRIVNLMNAAKEHLTNKYPNTVVEVREETDPGNIYNRTRYKYIMAYISKDNLMIKIRVYPDNTNVFTLGAPTIHYPGKNQDAFLKYLLEFNQAESTDSQ